MLKNLFTIVAILFIFVVSAGAAVVGLGEMIVSLVTHNNEFKSGLELFLLGTITFIITLVAYVVGKILDNTQIIAKTLADVLDNMDSGPQPMSPFSEMFGGGFPFTGSVKVAKIDKDGNITSLGENEFHSKEEFIKFRNEFINKAMGKDNKKQISDMTLEELESERIAAEERQDFELCKMLRDLINERKNKRD